MSIVPAHCHPILAAAEARMAQSGLPGALAELRRLTIDEFATLLFRVPNGFPALQAALPIYPPADVQMAWAGNSDALLLRQTALFSRLADQLSRRYREAPLADARILDYGCGWGRLLRQMLYFSDPDRLFGVDPWDKSLDLCRALRVPGEILRVDYRPSSLPPAIRDIDLGYAFSVFTHIGEANTREVLRCIHAAMAPGGLFIATIRPLEYWRTRASATDEDLCNRMQDLHRAGEFAFVPSGAAANAGSSDYGEASCSIETFTRIATDAGWRFAGTEWLLIDPYQQLVCLQA